MNPAQAERLMCRRIVEDAAEKCPRDPVLLSHIYSIELTIAERGFAMGDDGYFRKMDEAEKAEATRLETATRARAKELAQSLPFNKAVALWRRYQQQQNEGSIWLQELSHAIHSELCKTIPELLAKDST